jgi:hypothetical protein
MYVCVCVHVICVRVHVCMQLVSVYVCVLPWEIMTLSPSHLVYVCMCEHARVYVHVCVCVCVIPSCTRVCVYTMQLVRWNSGGTIDLRGVSLDYSPRTALHLHREPVLHQLDGWLRYPEPDRTSVGGSYRQSVEGERQVPCDCGASRASRRQPRRRVLSRVHHEVAVLLHQPRWKLPHGTGRLV